MIWGTESLGVFLKAAPLSFIAFLPVINPIGTAFILLGLTRAADVKTRRRLALRIAQNTVLFLAVILLGGKFLLAFFGISVPIVQVAGGLVLAAMGWNLLNKNDFDDKTHESAAEASEDSYWERAFYPFTFPITAGPGCVAVALTLSAHTSHASWEATAGGQAGALVGIVGNALLVYVCFAYSQFVAARLGKTGVNVMMRLISFLVVCIGAEIGWTGVRALLQQVVH
jgi:multiple antibiotic resistance protein